MKLHHIAYKTKLPEVSSKAQYDARCDLQQILVSLNIIIETYVRM
jgi:hypothetical protein